MNPSSYYRSRYSRLQSKHERLTKQQVYLFMAASIGLLVLLIYFGIPFLFNLASRISSLRKSPDQIQQDLGLAPSAPNLSQDFNATSSAQISIHGTADPKITVEVFQNDRSTGTVVAGDDGKFSQDVTLEKGENTFVAQAISEKGKKSDKSDSYNVSFSTTPPKLEVNLKDGNTVSDSQISVTGKTDPGNSLSINDHLTIVNSDGSFSYVLNLNEGDNRIKFVASDQAGNQTKQELTIKFSRP